MFSPPNIFGFRVPPRLFGEWCFPTHLQIFLKKGLGGADSFLFTSTPVFLEQALSLLWAAVYLLSTP
jgi:hypothetical protein